MAKLGSYERGQETKALAKHYAAKIEGSINSGWRSNAALVADATRLLALLKSLPKED